MVSHPADELLSLLPDADVRTDAITRLVYAHDASSYRLVPEAVVYPHNSDDVKTLLWWSKRHKIPLTFRTAGTSLSGQAVGNGVIVDVSRWKNLSIEENGNFVQVSPGYIGGMVNARLKQYGRKIGPDPASINACMIGGIIANNASGMCCGVHNNSYHTLHSISFILPDGTEVNTALEDAEERFKHENFTLYYTIADLRDKIRNNESLVHTIRHKYRIKNTVGYGLNSFLDFDRVTDILGHLMVGSEGTLGFIKDVTLRTIPDKPFKRTALLYFRTINQACRAIEPLRSTGAEALELMDRASLRSIEDDPIAPSIIKQLDEKAACILIELQAETEYEVEQMCISAEIVFDQLPIIEKPILTDDIALQNQYWKIRKGMFPTVGAKRPSGTGIINEDIAFPVERLAEGIEDLHGLFEHYQYHDAIVFGHAKDGNLHFVIAQAFDTENDIKRYELFMDDLADLIINKHNGSLKAEHGTGRNIAPYVSMEWGEKLYEIMCTLKSAIDPNNILNPGVIINSDRLCHVQNLKPFPHIEKEVNACIECGFCEHKCPSKELTLTPRQRIILQREKKHLSQQNDEHSKKLLNELIKHYDYSVIETCATDGLCETVCPVHINTGEFVKNLKRNSHTVASERIATTIAKQFSLFEYFSKKSLRASKFLSHINKENMLFSLSNSVNRMSKGFIPKWSEKITFPTPAKVRKTKEPQFILFSTCSSRILGLPTENEYSLVETIYELSKRAGVRIKVSKASGQCCGMMWDSKGHNEAAEISANKVLRFLRKESDNFRIPIVFDTSSCFTYFRKNLELQTQKSIILYDISEFLMLFIAPKLQPVKRESRVALHIPCSLEKYDRSQTMINLAKEYADEVIIPEFSGCCGFAGDKGFNVPELNESATKREKSELRNNLFDGFYSSNTTCEIGMSGENMQFRSIAYLLEKTTRK